jgi:hypothetical protein
MAAIRRPPKAPPRPKRKVKAPLHQRILGRAQVELDTLEDLYRELEEAHNLDLIEYDTYLDCCEALDQRKAKATLELDKVTGRYVKPDKKGIKETGKPKKRLSKFQEKLILVCAFLILLKIFTLR